MANEDVVWQSYEVQDWIGTNVVCVLPDERRVRLYGGVLSIRSPHLVELMDTATRVIDLRASGLDADALQIVLDHIHGAFSRVSSVADSSGEEDDDEEVIQITARKQASMQSISKDFDMLCAVLGAANYCGAEQCKLWIEEILVNKHIRKIAVHKLTELLEYAYALNADRLFSAVATEVERRRPRYTRILDAVDPKVAEGVLAINQAKIIRKNRELAVAVDGRILMYDSATGKLLRSLDGHGASFIFSITYSQNGALLASCSADNTARVWNPESGECLHILHHQKALVYTLAFSPIGQILLATGSRDALLRLWSAENGKCLKSLRHNAAISCLKFCPNGKMLASAAGATITLWHTSNWSRSQVLQHTGIVKSLDFSNHATLISSNKNNSSIRLWSLATNKFKVLRTFNGHQDDIESLAFSRDQRQQEEVLFASGSKDRSIRLWSAESGRCILHLAEHAGVVNSLAFSPDATSLATCSWDCTLRLWDLPSGKCIQLIELDLPLQCVAFRY